MTQSIEIAMPRSAVWKHKLLMIKAFPDKRFALADTLAKIAALGNSLSH